MYKEVSLAVLQNNHWSIIRNRYLSEINAGYEFLNKNIKKFQLSYSNRMQLRTEFLEKIPKNT